MMISGRPQIAHALHYTTKKAAPTDCFF